MDIARIKTLKVKHFRSIADETINLGDLTILVGQNAVGKSNVVDAIRFIRDALADGLDQAVSIRNGVRVVRQASSSKKPYNVELSVDYSVTYSDSRFGETILAEYGFKFSSSTDELKVIEEWGDLIEFDVNFGDEDVDVIIDPSGKIKVFRDKAGEVKIDSLVQKRTVASDELVFSRPSRFPFTLSHGDDVFDSLLVNARFAAIYPNVMRAPAPSQTTAHLAEDCRNWASVIRTMRKSADGRASLKKVIELTRYVLPQLEDVTVKSVGGFLVPHFRFERGAGRRDMDLIPYQLSDGTLRLFGLLLALYQSPPASFLAIEEPEQMVHPGALRVLADAFNEVKERTQLLITTHSPYLLELFDPDCIRVVTQDGDGTRVGVVSDKQLDLISRRLMTLPEIMVMDGLEAS